jgi:hypothetical protein
MAQIFLRKSSSLHAVMVSGVSRGRRRWCGTQRNHPVERLATLMRVGVARNFKGFSKLRSAPHETTAELRSE